MSEFHQPTVLPDRITGAQARRAPLAFNVLNIVAVLIPLPFMVFWLGASMVLFAMNRHHPNAKVITYVQAAAIRLYAIAGAVIPIGTFFSLQLLPWLIYWALAIAIMIPLSVRDLLRIRADQWDDTDLRGATYG